MHIRRKRLRRYADVKTLQDVPEEKIRQMLDDLIRRKQMVCLSDRYLELAADHGM